MNSRLQVGLLRACDNEASHTWNELFGKTVRAGTRSRQLELLPRECVEVFLVSGPFEERGEYAGNVLGSQDCQIVLCSRQYSGKVRETLNYLVGQDFHLYFRWLNRGYRDADQLDDHLGSVNEILLETSMPTIRDGKIDAHDRVHGIREFVYGWARYRDLICSCWRLAKTVDTALRGVPSQDGARVGVPSQIRLSTHSAIRRMESRNGSTGRFIA